MAMEGQPAGLSDAMGYDGGKAFVASKDWQQQRLEKVVFAAGSREHLSMSSVGTSGSVGYVGGPASAADQLGQPAASSGTAGSRGSYVGGWYGLSTAELKRRLRGMQQAVISERTQPDVVQELRDELKRRRKLIQQEKANRLAALRAEVAGQAHRPQRSHQKVNREPSCPIGQAAQQLWQKEEQ
jgi:hypothetical protein